MNEKKVLKEQVEETVAYVFERAGRSWLLVKWDKMHISSFGLGSFYHFDYLKQDTVIMLGKKKNIQGNWSPKTKHELPKATQQIMIDTDYMSGHLPKP